MRFWIVCSVVTGKGDDRKTFSITDAVRRNIFDCKISILNNSFIKNKKYLNFS